jgi:EmrB/QacA subfamily drug resistance transporter
VTASPPTTRTGAPPPGDQDQRAERIHHRRWYTLAVLCLSLVLIVAGNASLNVALPYLQTSLGSSSSSLQWIVDVYGLVFAGLLLPAGALADRFGRKTSLQFGLVLFALSALAASFATETWQVIAMRASMGVGAAFIMPATLSVLTNVFHEPAERRRAISIWAGFAGLGGAVGTLVSGFLLEHFSWGSTFLVNVPLSALALGLGLFLVPNSSDPAEAKLDPLGALLAVVGLTSLLYGIIEGPGHGWLSVETLATLGFGVLFLVLFVRWELRVEQPMLDVRLFTVRPFAIGSATITLQYFAMFGLYFALAQYLQLAHGYSALEVALIGLPIGVFALIGAPTSASLVGRFGPRRVVGSGLIVSGTGLLVLGWASEATPLLVILFGFCLVGLGNGQTTAPSTTLIMSSVPRAKSGVGSAVNDLSRELGGALGIAVLGSIMASAYRNDIAGHLAKLPLSPGQRQSASASIVATMDAAKHLPAGLGRELVHQSQATFAHAFGLAMLAGAAVIFLNSFMVWSLQHREPGHAA